MTGATDIVLKCSRAFERMRLEYMLVGSFSSNYYGRPRQTMDADFVVATGDLPVAPLREILGSEFYFEPQMAIEAVTGAARWLARHEASVFEVEIFALTADAHDQARFARRRFARIAGVSVTLPAAEDVVVTKLRWSKVLGRPKDIEDAREILFAQRGRLDLPYMRNWCTRHGTEEILSRLADEAT